MSEQEGFESAAIRSSVGDARPGAPMHGAMGRKAPRDRGGCAGLRGPAEPVGGVRIQADEAGNYRFCWIAANGDTTEVTPDGLAWIRRDEATGAIEVMWGQP